MPFVELKQPTNFVRVKKGCVVVSRDIYKEFFESKRLKKIRIFIDFSNHIVGLKPSSEGYKISKHGLSGTSFCCAQLSRTTNGEFHPVWSRKHEMLLFVFPYV